MPGFGARDYEAQGALVTPYRNTTVTFDLEEVVAVEPPFTLRRYGRGIVPDATDPNAVENVEMLASGYWSLRPRQEDLHRLHERIGGPPVMLLSEFNASLPVNQEPLHRAPVERTGVMTGADPALATSHADLFFVLRVGASFDLADLPLTAQQRVQPSFDTENIRLDKVMEGNKTHDYDQGYLLRWECPGTHRHAPDNVLAFYFGGPLSGQGFGEYGLIFHGNGECALWEYTGEEWLKRMVWQFTAPHQVMNAAHTMRIIPHCRKFIEFRSETNRLATPHLLGQTRQPGAYAAAAQGPTTQLYTVDPAVTRVPLDARWVTGRGTVKVAVRRDLKPAWQISKLEYPQQGGLLDSPFVVPWALGAQKPLIISHDGCTYAPHTPVPGEDDLVTPVTAIVTSVRDWQTAAALAPHGGGTGYVLPADENVIQVGFILQSFAPQSRSPYLAGYTAWREGSQATITPGEKSGGALVDVSITGPTSDPTHETANLVIEDLPDALPALRARGHFSVRVATRYDPLDDTLESVLFRGRAIKPEARRAGPDIGQAYPDPEWRTYDVTCVGEWARLAEPIMAFQPNFAVDPNAPKGADGNRPPWKITDLIRTLIREAGWPLSQIDVPDIPDARMPTGSDANVAFPSPFTSYADYIQRLARDYLGHFLLWDENAIKDGLRGVWRLLPAPRVKPTDVAVWEFTHDEPPAPAAGAALTYRSEAYPINTSPIRRGTFRSWTVPPEANAVIVTALGNLRPDRAGTNLTQSLINYLSYDPPGGPGLADPTHPDYLGRLVPLVVTDPGIAGGQTGEAGQAIVNAVARRLLNFACRSEKRVVFESELVLISPVLDPLWIAAAPADRRKRPLRRGDYILVEGEDFLVDTCDHAYQRDGMQCQVIEAVAWREEI